MKQFISILFLFIFCAFSVVNNKEQIEYSEQQKLAWSDYKARPNKTSSFKALTATRISFKANSDGKKLNISIKNIFEPQNSWTKTQENIDLLEHERLHFHISELFARELRKEILTTKFRSKDEKLMNEISEMYKHSMKELTEYQKQYDKESEHSINEFKQKEWEGIVFKRLSELKPFESSEIEISL
jgi:hypothetical protein